jgi:hypothetical protein
VDKKEKRFAPIFPRFVAHMRMHASEEEGGVEVARFYE